MTHSLCVIYHIDIVYRNCRRHTYEWGMSHVWVRHVTHMSEACHTYESRGGHDSHSHDSFKYVTRHMDVRNDTCICVAWLNHMCDMTHSYVWHGSFMSPSNLWRRVYAFDYLSIYVTWLIHLRDMTHSYVWDDSFSCVTWLIRMCDMTHSYVWHDSTVTEWDGERSRFSEATGIQLYSCTYIYIYTYIQNYKRGV